MDTNLIQQLIQKEVAQQLKSYRNDWGFTDRKVTDTPTDSLAVVNRKYVNLSGTVANRPTSSVATMGQRFFSTDTNIPMSYNANSSVWANGVGSVVAQG